MDLGGRRIGVITTSYPREAGDPAGAFVAGFTRFLAEANARPEVIAAGPGCARLDGIDVHRVPGWNLFYSGGAPDALGAGGGGAWLRAGAFQAQLAAAAMRRAGGWEGIVSHWLVPSGLAAEAARRGRAIPHVAVAHSSDVWLLRRSMAGRAAVRLLARRADLVYAGAHLVVEGAPGRVVPMGVDAAACRPEGPEARARGRARFLLHRTNDGRPVALFLGRLVPVKGLDLLLEALPEEFDLLVAGDGPLRASLERRARDRSTRVRFLGEVRGDDKRDLLAAADLLVVPSRRLPDGREEGTPTVIFEARAAGLPIVATRTGGAASVLTDGEDALLCEPAVPSLRAALLRLARDPDLYARLRAAADPDRHDWRRVGPMLAKNLIG